MQADSVQLVYQDQNFVFINKPAGLLSQPHAQKKFPDALGLSQALCGTRLYLQHRLDRETSGIMVFGKTDRANIFLTSLFREHRIQKKYLALTKSPQRHSLNETWTIENSLAPVRDPKKQLQRMVIVKKGGWLAKTRLTLLAQNKLGGLVLCQPETGRTHQIRVHLASEKSPILGDRVYGGQSELTSRMMLHAQVLEFHDPFTDQPLRIEAPLPKDFLELAAKLQLASPYTGTSNSAS